MLNMSCALREHFKGSVFPVGCSPHEVDSQAFKGAFPQIFQEAQKGADRICPGKCEALADQVDRSQLPRLFKSEMQPKWSLETHMLLCQNVAIHHI